MAGKLSFESAPYFGAKVAGKNLRLLSRAAEKTISHAPARVGELDYFFFLTFFLAAFFFFAMAQSPPFSCTKCKSWKSAVNAFFKIRVPIFSRGSSA
ncbi:MAG: hypothetical protein ABSF29_11395 [Tepidisphaeraceae bacterium]